MKKYGILAVATILAIAGILAAGSFTKQPATEVTAFVLEAAPVEKKVVCSGNIETADSTNNFYVDEAIGAVEGTEIQGVGDGRKLIRGDLNEDGRIDGVDLALIRRGLTAGFADSYAEIAADVNQDTQITVAEAVLIQNYLIGRIREFPVEAPEKSVG